MDHNATVRHGAALHIGQLTLQVIELRSSLTQAATENATLREKIEKAAPASPAPNPPDTSPVAPLSTSAYGSLLSSYRSGQMSERQWQAHLTDAAFRAWLDRYEAAHARLPS